MQGNPTTDYLKYSLYCTLFALFIFSGFIEVAYSQSPEWSDVYRMPPDRQVWQPSSERPLVAVGAEWNLMVRPVVSGSDTVQFIRFGFDGETLSESSLPFEEVHSVEAVDLDREGGVHVVWLKGAGALKRLEYSVLDGSASTIRASTSLTGEGFTVEQSSSRVDGEGRLHLLYVGKAGEERRLVYAIAFGNRVQTEAVIAGGGLYSAPFLALDENGGVHMAYWERNMDDAWDLQYMYNDPGGVNRTATLGDSQSLDEKNVPSLTVDSAGLLHVAWTEEFSTARASISTVYYSCLDAEGAQMWKHTVSEYNAGWPSLSVDGEDRVHVAWTDWRSRRMEIWYTSLHLGEAEVSPVKISRSPSGSWLPVVAVDGADELHVFWVEFIRDGVRTCYRNTVSPRTSNLFKDFMYTYNLQSVIQIAGILLPSVTASLLIGPVAMLYPSNLAVVLLVYVVSRLRKSGALHGLSDDSFRAPVALFLMMFTVKAAVVYLKLPLYVNPAAQLLSFTLAFHAVFFAQRLRGGSPGRPEKWLRTGLLSVYLDAVVNVLPVVMAFFSGF